MTEPSGVLGEIAAAKREELGSCFDGVSLDALRARARPTRRSFTETLAKPGARFILEIKKASPSAGAIRPGADPAVLARGYAGVADALSVLCDRAYFGGSLDDLAAARAEFDGPILAKDFFIDIRQVAKARIAGADAVLVMLSLLDDSQACAIIAEARRFEMDALVEVHDESEMRRALALGCPLIGINNRDLRDMSIDLATTERLAPMAPDCILVSESGVSARSDVDRLAPSVDSFLVGSALMRASEPAQAARELIFGRIKVCGLTCGADLDAARPAAFSGFVFVPGSPRHITAQEAAPLAGLAHKSGMLPVGVFRGAPKAQVVELAKALELAAVQIHGTNDRSYLRELKELLPSATELWAMSAVERSSVTQPEPGADRILYDTSIDGHAGGTGRTFDWNLIRGDPDLNRNILAGGLDPSNARAASEVGAYALDVCSGTEAAPGRKDPAKIAAFFEALRPSARERLRACA